MGNNQTQKMQQQPQRAFQQQMSCQDDLMCQNIDSKRSTVDNMVLVCPNAKCLGGTCSCGDGCERDSYTGICCSKVEKDRNGNTYCIEDQYDPTRYCKIPDQTYNGVKIPGKKICEWANNKY